LNLISQRLDTIYQIKPKRATVLFLHLFVELNTPKVVETAGINELYPAIAVLAPSFLPILIETAGISELYPTIAVD
jgi:hypothetical protein